MDTKEIKTTPENTGTHTGRNKKGHFAVGNKIATGASPGNPWCKAVNDFRSYFFGLCRKEDCHIAYDQLITLMEKGNLRAIELFIHTFANGRNDQMTIKATISSEEVKTRLSTLLNNLN